MVQVLGFEPRLSGSEPLVLPIRRLLIMGCKTGLAPAFSGFTGQRLDYFDFLQHMAEGKGFEPLRLLHLLVFKTSAIGRSANLLYGTLC